MPRDTVILGVLTLLCSLSFGLGYLAGKDAGQGTPLSAETPAPEALPASGAFVASKNGTKYYLPSCTGAARIAEKNKIWFTSASAAASAGYAPAANCKGI